MSDMSQTSVIILSGLPGSGKSTFGKRKYPHALKFSADDAFETPEGYKFDPSRISEAHAACLRGFLAALQAKASLIVVDNTNTSAVEIAPYAALALAFGATVEIVTVRCSAEDALRYNTHGVGEKTIMYMAQSLDERKLPPWWDSREVGPFH
jgi:predicted kinase